MSTKAFLVGVFIVGLAGVGAILTLAGCGDDNRRSFLTLRNPIPGVDGQDGQDGQNGTNGTSCTVEQVSKKCAKITCEDGSFAFAGDCKKDDEDDED